MPPNSQIKILPTRPLPPSVTASPQPVPDNPPTWKEVKKVHHTGQQKIRFLDAFRAGVESYKADRLTTSEVAAILTTQLGFTVTKNQIQELRSNLGETWTPRGLAKVIGKSKKAAALRILFAEFRLVAYNLGHTFTPEFVQAEASLSPEPK